MLIRKLCAFLICIVVLMAVGGKASGADAKESNTAVDLTMPPRGYMLERAPWPTLYGNPDRARRSDFKGPGGKITVETHLDLFGTYNLGYLKDGKSFNGILVGPGNDFYFHYWFSNESTLYAYRPSTGPLWQAAIRNCSNFCLDVNGRVYYLRSYGQDYENRYEVICRSADGTIHWNYRFGPAITIDIIAVGKRVYVGEVSSSKVYITAINLDGTKAWQKGPFDYANPIYCAEDGQGNAYLRFEFCELGLLKFGENGALLWQNPSLIGGDPHLCVEDLMSQCGPICVDDGRVWSDEDYVHLSGIGNVIPYSVFNDDGSSYKAGHYDVGKIIGTACYGSNGRLFLYGQFGATLKCYEDFDQEVWSVQLPIGDDVPPGGRISTMILDRENIIYVVYAKDKERVLYALDPWDGHMLGSQVINTLGEQGIWDWLAIGQDEKLIWLNNKGFVKIFKQAVEIKPEIVEMVQPLPKQGLKTRGDD